MLIRHERYVGFRCPECGRTNIKKLSIFDFCLLRQYFRGQEPLQDFRSMPRLSRTAFFFGQKGSLLGQKNTQFPLPAYHAGRLLYRGI